MTAKSGPNTPKRVPQWTVQVNDLIGGFIVTNHPHPLSEFDHRPDGAVENRGYIIAETIRKEDADDIAALLNIHCVEREGWN
jgi:hypothetical protein